MIAFHFIQSSAFSCLDLRYLHATSNPYPPPRLILFPVNLVSKNYPGRVKTRRYTYILPKEYGPRLCLRNHCNCITVLLISGFACAVISLFFDRGPDMLIDVVSSNKTIKFIRAKTCLNWNFFFDIFQ